MSALLLSLVFTARAEDPDSTEKSPSPATAAPADAEATPLALPAPEAAAEPAQDPAATSASEAHDDGAPPDDDEVFDDEVEVETRGLRLRAPAMVPYGMLQVFTTLWDQDESPQADPASYGDPEADPGFQIARARLGFTGKLPALSNQWLVIDYGLSVGIGTPYDTLTVSVAGVGIVDAWARGVAHTPVGPTSISLGVMKLPFSRELLLSAADQVSLERAVGPSHLVRVRDTGVVAGQAFVLSDAPDAPQILVNLGVFNGNGDPFGDQDPGMLYVGRVEFAKGETYRTWDPDGRTAVGVAASGLLDDALATRSVGWNLDGLLRIGPWSLMGEIGGLTLTPTDPTVGVPEVLATTKRLSWVASTSVFVRTRADRGVEFQARASSYDDNTRLSDNGDVLIVHGGAIWRNPVPFLDVGAGYIHRAELGGRTLANDTIRIWTQIRPQR